MDYNEKAFQLTLAAMEKGYIEFSRKPANEPPEKYNEMNAKAIAAFFTTIANSLGDEIRDKCSQ